MDKKSLSLLLGIPVFLALPHLGVLPILRRVSIAIQGEPFIYRFQAWIKSETSEHLAKRDIPWSMAAVMLAMMSLGRIIVLLTFLGIIPKDYLRPGE